MPKLHIFAGGSCLNNNFTRYLIYHCISSQPVIPRLFSNMQSFARYVAKSFKQTKNEIYNDINESSNTIQRNIFFSIQSLHSSYTIKIKIP